MSKLKNPRAKKAASLSRDRRNAYGENSKASRKNIPRSKARAQRKVRRAVHQALEHAESRLSDVEVQTAENQVAAAWKKRKLTGFRKTPDVPLAEHLAGKRRRPAR